MNDLVCLSGDIPCQCSVHAQVDVIARQFEPREKTSRRLCLFTKHNRMMLMS